MYCPKIGKATIFLTLKIIMKKYYYLDGPNKKGPFSIEELINLNLDEEVLIWTEGFSKWKPIKEVEEISSFKRELLEPSEKELKDSIKSKGSRKLVYSFLLSTVLFTVMIGILYLYNESDKSEYSKYRHELSNRIDKLFGGKPIICDGVNYKVRGRLEKPKGKRYIVGTNKEEGAVEKFYRTSGGFTFKKLSIKGKGYQLEVYKSEDLIYTSMSYNRGSVQEKYDNAFKYYLDENSGCYSKGIYELIGDFEYLHNKYYAVEVNYDLLLGGHWTSNPSLLDDYSKIFISYDKWYYEITPRFTTNENFFEERTILFFFISLVIFILLVTINPFKW